MNYKLCELYNKYTILSNYEQNTRFIQIAPCFRGSFHFLECCKCARMRFHCATVLVVLLLLRTLEGALLTMQCKWTFTKLFILSTLQRKYPVLR